MGVPTATTKEESTDGAEAGGMLELFRWKEAGEADKDKWIFLSRKQSEINI